MISQIDLIADIYKHLNKNGYRNTTVRQMNAVIEAATDIVNALEKEDIRATPNMGLHDWLRSDDTGQSSKYMARILCDAGDGCYAHPYDPDDLGRCIRFLQAVPEAREKLNLLKTKSSYWKLLVEDWDALEKLYEYQRVNAESCRKDRVFPCYDEMVMLQKLAEEIDGKK